MASIVNADNGSVSGSAGLKSSADNSGVLALQTNGTTAVTVDASQNVGIGTASPSTKLHVVGEITATQGVGGTPVFSAYASSQTISSSTATNITYTTEEFDTAGCFNNTGSTVTLNGLSVPAYAFCPNVAGYYQINGEVCYNTVASARYCYIIIYKNGGLWKQGSFCPLNSSDYASVNVQAVVYLNGTGDYVQIYSGQNSTGSVTTVVAGVSYTHFSGVMVRGA
jgi:hypothetical protein